MDKLFNWLLQTTPDGATYLQVVMIGTLILVLMNMLCITTQEIFKIVKEEKGDEDEKNDE